MDLTILNNKFVINMYMCIYFVYIYVCSCMCKYVYMCECMYI